ncbi:MAG: triose-phosphate isomerase, partial [Spirochaetae bacterium HGW-Spirochaetae-6]
MHSRKNFFGGNWKMYKNLAQARIFFEEAQKLQWNPQRETVFFPPFHLLLPLQNQFSPPFFLGAQNFHP